MANSIHMKLRILPLLALVRHTTFIAPGCVSGMIEDAIRTSRVQNWMPLHANARKGDYALRRLSDGSTLRYEVTATENGVLSITRSFVATGDLPGVFKDYVYHIKSTPDGTVKEAVVYKDGKPKMKLAIAEDGFVGYYQDLQNYRLPSAPKMEVAAGAFRVNNILLKEVRFLDGSGVKERAAAVIFLSNEAKFGAVKTWLFRPTDEPLIKLKPKIEEAVQSGSIAELEQYLDSAGASLSEELANQG